MRLQTLSALLEHPWCDIHGVTLDCRQRFSQPWCKMIRQFLQLVLGALLIHLSIM